MENKTTRETKTEPLKSVGIIWQGFPMHRSLELSPSGTFDDHVAKAEAVFWRNQLGSAPPGLRRLAEKVYDLSGIGNVQRVERVKFVCDIGCLSRSSRVV